MCWLCRKWRKSLVRLFLDGEFRNVCEHYYRTVDRDRSRVYG